MTNDHDLMIDQDHLREMIEVISGELELRPLLTVIVQKACELLHADRGSIGLVDAVNDQVVIEAVFKMPPEELGSVTRRGEGLAGRVYEERQAVLLGRYGDLSAPPLSGMDEDSVIGMPIMWRGDMIGTFGIGAAAPKRFGDNDVRMLEVFARHAAIAINNARSYEREKNFAVLKERQRLSRDLHDNVSQLIFSLTLVAQSIATGFEKGQAQGEARIARLLEISTLAQKEMKALLAELKGSVNDTTGSMAAYAKRNGLARALERHCQLTAPEGARCTVQIENGKELAPEITETLLRIAQEALSNAFRHGKAEHVEISLARREGQLIYRIVDNGQGLALSQEKQGLSTNIGLDSMRARALKAGGHLVVTNRTEGGTCVEVRIPLA